jgi:pimeloyl-ACP methyl ester carboxylesterase
MGGNYAAEAAEANPEQIDRLVLLAAGDYTPLLTARARKLFIMSRDDIIGDGTPRLPQIRRQYEKASETWRSRNPCGSSPTLRRRSTFFVVCGPAKSKRSSGSTSRSRSAVCLFAAQRPRLVGVIRR